MDNRFEVVVGARTLMSASVPSSTSGTGGLLAASWWKPIFSGGYLLYFAAVGLFPQ
jgi:hypothetical protein